jgi:hypothetical protein
VRVQVAIKTVSKKNYRRNKYAGKKATEEQRQKRKKIIMIRKFILVLYIAAITVNVCNFFS